jgi:hypothetical protein
MRCIVFILVVITAVFSCSKDDCPPLVKSYLDETIITNDYSLASKVILENQGTVQLTVVLGDTSAKVLWESPQGGQFLNNANESTIKWKAPFVDIDSTFIIKVTATKKDSTYDDAAVIIQVQHNRAPTLNIEAPQTDASLGQSLPIEVTFADPDKDEVRIQTSATGGIIILASDITISPISALWIAPELPGLYLIFASATDGLLTVFDTLIFNAIPNSQPEVSIINPKDNTTFNWRQTITFQGAGIDPEDGPLPPDKLVWNSNLSGYIGIGTEFSLDNLSTGNHIITLKGTDNFNFSAEKSVRIIVLPNNPPVTTITSPTNGRNFVKGENIVFQGTAIDNEDGRLSGFDMIWLSSIQGVFGSGENFQSRLLKDGTHTISLQARDSEGAQDTAKVVITVENNDPPFVTITSPTDGSMFFSGRVVTFAGTGIDPERGNLPGTAFKWNSSVNGDIGTGNPLAVSTLSQGHHIITLTCTDAEGLDATDRIEIDIQDVIWVPQQFPTIQLGINAAQSGDYVLVSAGTYNESISVPDKITVLSDKGPSVTKISARNVTTIVSIEGTSVFGGFTIDADTSVTYGIRILMGKPEVKHNVIKNPKNGLIMERQTECYFHNNIIWNCKGIGVNIKTNSIIKAHNNVLFQTKASGFKLEGTATGDIRNNLLGEIGSNSFNDAVFNCDGSGVNIDYNMYWTYTKIFNVCALGTGNRSDFPRFIDDAIGNFKLQANSNARNAGDPADAYKDTDGSRNDMGAYGGPDPMP